MNDPMAYQNLLLTVLVVLIVLSAGCIAGTVWYRMRLKRLMDSLERMLEAAIAGSFEVVSFDESRLSRLEEKLFRYLAASNLEGGRVAEDRERIKTLIGDISHQTKTPISNILLYGQLIQEQQLPKEAEQMAEQIVMQSEKLSFLIQSLLKISRLESGVLQVKPERNHISALIDGLEAVYAPLAKEKGIAFCANTKDLEGSDELENSGDRELPDGRVASGDLEGSTASDLLDDLEAERGLTAVFDLKWTLEAVGNILDNGIKYTPEGGKIVLSVKPYEMFVRIDVADSGIGIPEEEHAGIFQRFYRGQAVRNQEGIGVGLYLSRQIVAAQSGYIKVWSEPGQGSVFSVFLARKEAF